MKPTNPFEVCTQEMLPFVQEYGGKFGPLEALRLRGDFAENLLETVFLRKGDTYKGNGDITRPIVRASHPVDIRDMVGVLETLIANGADDAEVNALADKIRAQAGEQDVIDFAHRSSEPGMYNPDDVILGVQQLVPGVRATVLSHPNRRADEAEFIISWFRDAPKKSNDALASGTEILSASYNARAKLLHVLGDTYTGKHQANMMPAKLIELYERVRDTRLMRDDRAFIMEVVGDGNDVSKPPIVCQLRDFKSRSLAGWRFSSEITSRFNLPKLVFGITPEEGIRMTVQHSPDGFGPDGKTPLPVLDRPWAFLRTQHQHETPLALDTTNMKAYLGGYRLGSGMPSLAHSQERMAAVAKVSVFENVHDVGYAWPVPDNDYDFSRRLLAEMDEDPLWHGSPHKLHDIRQMMHYYSRDTVQWGMSLDDLLHRTRGKMFDIILRSDGHTATMDIAPGQETRALRGPVAHEQFVAAEKLKREKGK